MTGNDHRCIFCRLRLTGEGDGYGMFDRLGFNRCDVAEDRYHMCHCAACHCAGECPEHIAA